MKDDYPEFCLDKWTPIFYSTVHEESILNEMLLDYFVSSCMQEVMKKKAAKDNTINWDTDMFTRWLFDCDDIICSHHGTNIGIPFPTVVSKADSLIGDNILYYNNRTNSLHFKVPGRMGDDKRNQVYCRRFNKINDYAHTCDICEISSKQFYSYTGLYFIECEIVRKDTSFQIGQLLEGEKRLVAMELSPTPKKDLRSISELIDKAKQNAEVTVLITDMRMEFPEEKADIIIEIKPRMYNDYMLKYLVFVKSALQDCMFGMHQYKRRDYGIEVYPRLGRYIHERRYLQRALVYTHSDAVTDTYSQYLKRQKFYSDTPVSMYEDYEKERNLKLNSYLRSIYPENSIGLFFADFLNKIFVPFNPLRHLLHKSENEGELEKDFLEMECMYGNSSFVTAVIGAPNTYKRFLTFGGIFGSSVAKEHTLIIMMNKEESVIRRRLMCPARLDNRTVHDECRDCYRHIHFMNICMGYITPEELLYFIERQIEVTYDGNLKRPIRRIVIDDLQILDFCFPLLKDNGLFLAALAELCRENDIILYVLCDRKSRMADALKSLADNVVLTDRDNEGHPIVYVEKFVGYDVSPSKMYCGRLRNVKNLFRCTECYDHHGTRRFEFQSNIVEIEEIPANKIKNL